MHVCSDKPGNHDFNLLKKLVLPDGSILRAKLPGRPTRDCLFTDPARDGKRSEDSETNSYVIYYHYFVTLNYGAYTCDSILKIWNLNEHNGVIGAFNCQGAGWCRVGKKNLIHDEQPGTVTGVINANNVDFLKSAADEDWNGDVILYSHLGGTCILQLYPISHKVDTTARIFCTNHSINHDLSHYQNLHTTYYCLSNNG